MSDERPPSHSLDQKKSDGDLVPPPQNVEPAVASSSPIDPKVDVGAEKKPDERPYVDKVLSESEPGVGGGEPTLEGANNVAAEEQKVESETKDGDGKEVKASDEKVEANTD